MMLKPAVLFVLLLLTADGGRELKAQALRETGAARETGAGGRETALPLRRLTLFSSGVGYFEHSGPVSGTAVIQLSFNQEAVNDVLKSLVVSDPRSDFPSLRYPSEDALFRSLGNLAVDLSGNPGIAAILGSQRGAELEVLTPNPLKGRIIGVEERPALEGEGFETCLSLLSEEGIRVLNLRDLRAFSFTDPVLKADLNRALDLLLTAQASGRREFQVELPGEGEGPVSLSYVIPAPVWKASYRLDLPGGTEGRLQGWAIVDNGGDTDWEGISLSLVTGRPVSFIQDLYPPLRLSRPVLPLAIAGIAPAETHDSSYNGEMAKAAASSAFRNLQLAGEEELLADTGAGGEAGARSRYAPAPAAALGRGMVESASGTGRGDQFEFTFRRPVTLGRGESAMLPLVEGTVGVEKTLVFSASRLRGGETVHPVSGAELVNATGMKLPAGPLTVYEGGTYAGDALIEFFPPGERRIVSWGEDLAVTGRAATALSRPLTAVTVSGGLMTINRKQNHERTYAIRNGSTEEKTVVVEHPITGGANLAEPASPEERTGEVYRFKRVLPPGGELSLTVREESPLSERISLTQLRLESFISYASSQEIPPPVRAALMRAVELRQEVDQAQTRLRDLDSRRDRLAAEQDRIRRNLEAAGTQSPQGQDYLRRMSALDGELDVLMAAREEEEAVAKRAQAVYDNYLASLSL